MNARQDRVVATGTRVANFLQTQHLDDPRLVKLLPKLIAVIARVRQTKVKQKVARTGAKLQIPVMRRELRRSHMLPISRAGKAFFRDEPRVLVALRVPHARADAETLVAAAFEMAKALQPHKTLFIEDGYTKDFLVQLRSAAQELKKWSSDANSKRVVRSVATVQLRDEIAELRQILSVIQGIVPGLVESNKTARPVWKRATRAQKRRGRPPAKKRAERPDAGATD